MAKETQKLFAPEDDGPIECLGITFENEEKRREHFTEILRNKLDDPEFRSISGFPTGSTESILEMSDPPFYTACPNPFLSDFLKQARKNSSETDRQKTTPYAIDVSIGKTDQLYRAHAYHTKVPHLAIVPSVLNYTQPGDIILDGFCGSGMTGVAVQWCATAPNEYRAKIEEHFKNEDRSAPTWGKRYVVLSDLSPAASFIASNFNLKFSVEQFAEAAERILSQVEEELGWMYSTRHKKDEFGQINYTVWSEVFACSTCTEEIIFVKAALNPETKRVEASFACPHCGAVAKKEKLDLLYTAEPTVAGNEVRQRPRRVPVIINYKYGGKTFEKEPDAQDLEVLDRVSRMPVATTFPTDKFPECQMLRVGRMKTTGVEYVDDLFIRRQAISLSRMWELGNEIEETRLRHNVLFFIEQAIWGMSLLNRYKTIMHGKTSSSNVNQYLSGVFYVPSQHSEASPSYNLRNRLKRLVKNAFSRNYTSQDSAIISIADCSNSRLPDDSIDYIFTDPPFGENIYYSDLNFLVEAWHGVFTDSTPEAIVDRVRGKSVLDYQRLMQACFKEYQRVLKPGRWITVVFHNSQNAIWNAIQEALEHAGLVVADVRTLDKKQGSFQQVVSGNTVKRDLIISAYKPNGGLEERFKVQAGNEEGVWDFVTTHLRQLPIFVAKSTKAEAIAERTSHLLFDRMVAFHVQRGVSVPLSAAEFRNGLHQRFPERDGMYFLSEQVEEYDRKRMTVSEVSQLELFVSDEASAIQWLKQQLKQKPQTFQELQPQFMQELSGWQKHEKSLELSELLDQNFLCYEDSEDVPSQIHSYLSSNFKDLRSLPKSDNKLKTKAKGRWYVPDPRKEVDLEKRRNRDLMKEFNEYRNSKGKLKTVRSEALRAGFKDRWQEKDFETIVEIGDRVREEVIQEDTALLMYYDNALMLAGE